MVNLVSSFNAIPWEKTWAKTPIKKPANNKFIVGKFKDKLTIPALLASIELWKGERIKVEEKSTSQIRIK